MNNSIRNIQLVAVVVVLISTIIAFFLEMREMYDNRDITLADLLLMFIYIEVIGLVRSYWETRAVRITYPLVIAITALARFIILQDKESDPTNLIYISVAILIVALATVIIRFRNSKSITIEFFFTQSSFTNFATPTAAKRISAFKHSCFKSFVFE